MKYKELITYDIERPLRLPTWINRVTSYLTYGKQYSFEDLFTGLIYQFHPDCNFHEDPNYYENNKSFIDEIFLHFYDNLSINDKRLIAIQFFKSSQINLPEYLSLPSSIRIHHLTGVMYKKYYSYFPDFHPELNYLSDSFKGFFGYPQHKSINIVMQRFLSLDSAKVFSELVSYHQGNNDKKKKHTNILDKYSGVLIYNNLYTYQFLKPFMLQNELLTKSFEKDFQKSIMMEYENILKSLADDKHLDYFSSGMKLLFQSISEQDFNRHSNTLWRLIKQNLLNDENAHFINFLQNFLYITNSIFDIPNQLDDIKDIEKSCFTKNDNILTFNAIRFVKVSNIYTINQFNLYSSDRLVLKLINKPIYEFYQKHKNKLDIVDFNSKDSLKSLTTKNSYQHKEIIDKHFSTYLNITEKLFNNLENEIISYLNISETSIKKSDNHLSFVNGKPFLSISWEFSNSKNIDEFQHFLLAKLNDTNINLDLVNSLFQKDLMTKDLEENNMQTSFKKHSLKKF